jgi:Mn-dependent DtxR family transcriptional regulator
MTKKKFLIHSWMLTQLGLSGNELVAYAYMYDVSNGGSKKSEGGYMELSDVMNTTVPTVYNTVKSLRAKGLVNYERVDSISINERAGF